MWVTAIYADLVQLIAAAIGNFAVRGEQHTFAIRAPAVYHIGTRVVRQPFSGTAGGRHHIDIGVVIVASREGNPLPIR